MNPAARRLAVETLLRMQADGAVIPNEAMRHLIAVAMVLSYVANGRDIVGPGTDWIYHELAPKEGD